MEAATTEQPTLDAQGRAYGTGKRKDSVARVWLKHVGKGKGSVTLNGKKFEEYFGREVLRMSASRPFLATDTDSEFEVFATLSGGGLSGQSGALRHGIARALVRFNPLLRSVLRKAGFLTRDSRVVERKKYGLRKARRRRQFSKR